RQGGIAPGARLQLRLQPLLRLQQPLGLPAGAERKPPRYPGTCRREDISAPMTAVDIVIVVLLAASTFAGFRQGFIVEVATILGALAGLAAARLEYKDLKNLLVHFFPHSSWLTVISYLLIFLVVWGVIIFAARWLRP